MNSRSCGGSTLNKNTLFQGGIFCECRLRCILHMFSTILLAECSVAHRSDLEDFLFIHYLIYSRVMKIKKKMKMKMKKNNQSHYLRNSGAKNLRAEISHYFMTLYVNQYNFLLYIFSVFILNINKITAQEPLLYLDGSTVF